jgi:hypothetical protein
MEHVYHRGYLSIDCHDLAGPDTKKLVALGKITPAIADLRRLRKMVWDAAERGEGYLLQRRHGPLDYDYLMMPVGRQNPRRNHR